MSELHFARSFQLPQLTIFSAPKYAAKTLYLVVFELTKYGQVGVSLNKSCKMQYTVYPLELYSGPGFRQALPVVGQLCPSDDDDDDDETGSSMDCSAGQGFIRRGRADSRRRSPVIYISHETICG